MDPAKLRDALGLPPDASDEDVVIEFTATYPTYHSGPTTPVVAAAAPGTRVVAESVWQEQQETIRTLKAFIDKAKREERDGVIAQAVKAGKFTPAQQAHFSQLWDADPDVTRNLIDALTPNSAVAVLAMGYAGETSEVDQAYAALYGDNGRKAG